VIRVAYVEIHERPGFTNMRTLFATLAAICVATLAGAYVYGVSSLSRSGATRFLDELEALSLDGKSAEYCDRLHEDLRVSIRDHSAELPADFDGGRQEFCAFVSYAAKGVDLLGLSTRVTREDFTVTRDWLHPWTAQVSYHEDRITTMSKINATSHTRSDDELTLVQTFDGVKLVYLQSRVVPSEAPN
jgi:hypothetical protein